VKQKEGPSLNMSLLEQWIGRQEVVEDTITIAPIRGLSATLDRADEYPQVGDSLHVPWHWLYFLPSPLASELSDDGHPKKGGFLPPVPLPKRMWAGGSIDVLELPKVGDHVKRVSTISDVKSKSGVTGELVFVTVKHEIFANARLLISERQDLVYREAPVAGTPAAAPKPAPVNANWSRRYEATPPLLFRYSALTFNTHRIHYDRDYAVNVEGYDDLVVHGPLLATLLLDLLRRERPAAQLRRFDYRAMRPLLANNIFSVEGRLEDENDESLTTLDKSDDGAKQLKKSKLWIKDYEGLMTMSATAFFVEE